MPTQSVVLIGNRAHWGKSHSDKTPAQEPINCGYGQTQQPVSLRATLPTHVPIAIKAHYNRREHTNHRRDIPGTPVTGEQGDFARCPQGTYYIAPSGQEWKT